MSEPEVKFVVDEYGRIGYRVTNEGVLLSKDEKEFIANHILHLQAENDRLRKLVLDYFNAPCLECNPWSEGWEGCKHCESGNCTLAVRTLELGIEVDG